MHRLVVALIRHGDYDQLAGTPSAHQPFALNARGVQQARDAAPLVRSALAEHGLSLNPLVDVSPLLRAWQTASLLTEELADAFPAPPRLREVAALTERCVGSVANLPVARIEQLLREDPRYDDPPAGWKASPHYCLPFPGAESLLQAGERVARHVERTAQQLRRRQTGPSLHLCVGHGGAFRHAALAMGVLPPQEVPRLSMHHATPVLLEYTADAKWRHVGGEWKVRAAGSEVRD